MNNVSRLFTEFGQSIWLDDLSHELLESGKLQQYINDGVRGLTSNPSILEKAIVESSAYDEKIKVLAKQGLSTKEIYLNIIEGDIKQATELFRPLWDSSGQSDGFVSLEVSPDLSNDFDGTMAEARRMWTDINAPNLMIKVPATEAGIKSIEPLLAEGINVNVTLIFGADQYRQVVAAYQRGISAKHPSKPKSVASFFVSRIDTEVDKRLEAIGGNALDLRGQAAIASAHLIYEFFRDTFKDKEQVQRLLWASTSVKNTGYDDLMYIRYLVAPNTVNTTPHDTVDKTNDHLAPDTIAINDSYITHAHQFLEELKSTGVDMDDVVETLKAEGLKKFQDAFTTLLAAIDSKR